MPECWCRRCEDKRLEGMDPMKQVMGRRFIVCPDCGYKRCPKASDHNNLCTGSNEPGQAGSDYA